MKSYLGLTKKIMRNELTEKELIECLDISNVMVIQQTLLKIVSKNIKSEYIRDKLVYYTSFMDRQFTVLSWCKIGHLAIYALKKLGYADEFQKTYNELSDQDKEYVNILIDKMDRYNNENC